jgi:succinate dehydrogenase / fumarate reductase, iron-sulfur subunit
MSTNQPSGAPGDKTFPEATVRILRGEKGSQRWEEHTVKTFEGMMVLDAVLDVQAGPAPDLSVRWNCKAGKCGSCSAEVNGKPRLMCMTRMDKYEQGQPITVEPMRAFPVIKDLVTDVKWNYAVAKKIPPFAPKPRDPDGNWRFSQREADRIQEFRKCIECFLCQDVCHVVRDHDKKDAFVGPRFLVHLATLDMHPLDTLNRREMMKSELGIGYCNITKCCTEVCPESITITDNAIIPLKERVADEHYDPVRWLMRKITGKPARQ